MLSWTSELRSEPVVALVSARSGADDVVTAVPEVHAVVLFIEIAAARAEAVHAVLPVVFHTPSGRMQRSDAVAGRS